MFTPRYGDDSSSFDWSSIVNTALTTTGNIVKAEIAPSATAAATPKLATTPTTSSSYTTMLLFGGAIVLGLVVFMSMKKR